MTQQESRYRYSIPKSDYRECYEASAQRDARCDGQFFLAVKTTGIFCRPSCPARQPLFENCEFHATAEASLLAGFRPCLRCKPLNHPDETSDVITRLISAVEQDPSRRWRDADFDELGMHASTARRHFRRHFGMTFVQYARARRLGVVFKAIRQGDRVINAQLESGFESGSGFRDAFSRIMGAAPVNAHTQTLLQVEWLDTPLGPMIAIAEETALWLLEFADRRGLEREIERLRVAHRAAILPGSTAVHAQLAGELSQYFSGECLSFKTSFDARGSDFRRSVWQALISIPPGQTRSYGQLAAKLGRPSAVRAVAQANGANQLSLIVPCHRVIGADGSLTGYGGGLDRKRWLLEHEARFSG